MSKKLLFLVPLVLLLGGLSIYLNRDRFRGESIQIGSRSLPPRGALANQFRNSKCNPVVFLLNRVTTIKSVKVISVAELNTDSTPHCLWELTTSSNSIPIKDFVYGANIRGMRIKTPGATPEPLEPGVQYRIVVDTGSEEAQHDFTPTPKQS